MRLIHVTVPRRCLLSILAFLSLALVIANTGCGGVASTPPPTKTLTSVSVTSSTPSVVVGATRQFTATATYSDASTANISSTATWSVGTQALATINSTGLATGVAVGSTMVTASLSGISGSESLTVTATTATLTSISVLPATASVVVGTTQQYTATATYSDASTANVSSTATWAATTPAVATINSTGLATGATADSTTITASLSGISGNASLTVMAGTNVVMWHFDAQRTGLNPTEASLTPTNVAPASFGKLFSYLLDGYEYGQPLLVSQLTIAGSTHNVVFAATENDSVYAFDSDNYGAGTPLWQTSLLQSGETPMTDGPIQPFQGITSTPVIDTTSNTMYVVSTQAQTAASTSTFRLNALDITTGKQKFGGPVTIEASVPGTNSDSPTGVDTLKTSCVQRAALLLANATVYIGFGGCHSGWLLAFGAQSLAQTGKFNASPNLNGEGPYASAGGVWMGGGGPAADANGNIYITTGNGPWDGVTAWGDSVLKFPNDGTLGTPATLGASGVPTDYFTPDDYRYMNCNDADLASGGLLLIPGSTQALAAGKTGKLYLVNTTNLGQEQANDAGATQTVPGVLIDQSFLPYSQSCTDVPGYPGAGTWTTDVNSYEFFSTASYFNGSVYVGITPTATAIPVGIVQFQYSTTLTPALVSSPPMQRGSNGTTTFISANGTTDGVLWIVDHGDPIQNQNPTATAPTTATLRAYDPNNLTTELYNSGINAGDAPGYGIKFTSPIVANGKVYIGTAHDLSTVTNPQGELDVYGAK
jgi:hypothetical protein